MAVQIKTPDLVMELEETGIVVLQDLVSPVQLAGMQRAFRSRLNRLRWNDIDGYEKNDRYRHMVPDVLTLEPGFLELPLHPRVKEIMRAYLGDDYALVEAKGWLSVPTRKDFHGWHGDAWYDQTRIEEVQRELKLAVYLTDVRSGAFNYIKGTHKQIHPRLIRSDEIATWSDHEIFEVIGPAGTVFIFDTSGVHRQATPILDPREAVFYNFHDPDIPLQAEDVEYYRYHPLILNAAFLGGLSEDDERILGFGDHDSFIQAFERKSAHTGFHAAVSRVYDALLLWSEYRSKVTARLERIFR